MPVYIVSQARDNEKVLEFARYVSPQMTFEAGLWPELMKAQRTMAHRKCINKLMSAEVGLSAHLKKRGTCFDLGFTTCPGGAGIQPGRMALKNDPEMIELNRTLISLYTKILNIAFLDRDEGAFERSWATNGSLTMGEINLHVSSIQLNFSQIGEAVEKGLEFKAHIHLDKNDDPTRLTIVLFLSKFPTNVFPGRFNITSAGLTCPADTFGALVFTGRHPHCSLGVGTYPDDLPLDSPLRSKLPAGLEYPQLPSETHPPIRINVVMYPGQCCMRPGKNPLRKLSDKEALGAFVTHRAQREFEARQFIKQNIGTSKTRDEIQNMFSWQDENGKSLYPANWIVDLGLKHAGRPNQEMEDRHEAALFTGFGNKIPLDDEGMKKEADSLAARKLWKRVRKEKAVSAGKVQCTHYIARRRKQRKKYFFAKEKIFGCDLHPHAGLSKQQAIDIDDDSWETRPWRWESEKIKNEFESDDGDDEYLPEESYDEDEEDPDELSS
jgi:hypothetical protein